jgi:capsular polysaccharide export protein
VNNIGDIAGKNILFLQGPVGLFFKKVGKQFQARGATIHRIGLNAGDAFFSSSSYHTPYRGKPEDWSIFISNFLSTKKIDKIFLFGDCRIYQSIAVTMADKLNIEVYVFEEGYLRPHYITLEKHGVNDYSRISRDAEFYKKLDDISIPSPKYSSPNPICNWGIVITYYFVAKLFSFRYPHYIHHRNFSALEEFFFGTRSLIRKAIYIKRDKKYLPLIKNELSGKYFFVPLQTHNDFQILQHSGYGSLEKFIIEVLESFAKHSKDELIIFKHHPIDRGRKNYKKFILEQSSLLSISNRVLVVHDLYLPALLTHAKGTITINSTVGLSSVFHNTPTITLGKAIYDIQGLTHKDMKLDDFWSQHASPDMNLADKFKQYLVQTTQLNGNFFGRMPEELQ